MESKNKVSWVQEDKFWTWRVNREENRMIQEIESCQEKESNVKRLKESIAKAKQVAANIKRRPTEKSTNT